MALGYVAWIVNNMWSKTATSSPLSVDKHSFVEYFKSFPKGREVLALKVTILWSQFEVLPTSKSKNEAFPPHHLLTMCAAIIRASNLLEATSTPTLNWGKGGGGRRWGCILFCFLRFTHLRTVSQQFCCQFSKSRKWPYCKLLLIALS